MQAALAGVADIHRRAPADCFEPLKNLNRAGVVLMAGGFGRIDFGFGHQFFGWYFHIFLFNSSFIC